MVENEALRRRRGREITQAYVMKADATSHFVHEGTPMTRLQAENHISCFISV